MLSTRAKQRRANEHCRNARAELSLIRWYDCNQTRAAFICERLILHPCAHPTRIKFANRCTHVHHHQHRVYIGGNATRFADFVLLCAKAVRNSSSIRSYTTALLSTTTTFKPLTPCRGFISLTLGVNGQFFFSFRFNDLRGKQALYYARRKNEQGKKMRFVIDLGFVAAWTLSLLSFARKHVENNGETIE